jgi:FKBP-type peptidyl-prolyl cis-trans isomerase
MLKNILLCTSILLVISCVNDTSKSPTVAKKAPENSVGNSDDLYKDFVANPGTQAEKDRNAIIEYAAENGLKCLKMSNGVYQCNVTKGTGQFYTANAEVSAHYKGYFLDGKEFDSSYKRNKPLSFKVGQMIKGWNTWLLTANPGTKATLLIPSDQAYGAGGKGSIPPNTPLAFDVELLFIEE